tara:strand:+ start:591 stop:1571 length:981 start_codon:yes stop_codon:yes gene_type:complete
MSYKTLSFSFLLACTTLTLSSCQKSKISSDETTVMTETYVHKYGVPLSEQSWKDRGENGEIVTLQKNGVTLTKTFKNGVLDGPLTHSFPFSDLIELTELYEKGSLTSQVWNYQNGTPKEKKLYQKNKKTIYSSWYQSGSPRTHEVFESDWLMTGDYYTADNSLESNIKNGQGTRIIRDGNGKLLAKENVESGLRKQKTTYFENGDPETVMTYLNGLEDGQKKVFGHGGIPVRIEEWSQGKQHGITTLFQNGQMQAELSYLNGKLEGLEKRYRHGNLLVEEIMWKNNERNGPSHSYINGKKISYWYHNGKQVSEKIYQELSKDTSTE